METANVQNITLTPKVANPTYIPVCLCGNELFIRKADRAEGGSYDVLRVMTKENLEWCRSDEGIREYYKEIWQSAVMGDKTELGLTDFINEDVDLRDRDEDDEWYPNKEAVGVEVFDEWEGLRELCDGVVYEDTDEEVGTWESSGWYSPDESQMQIIFNTKK